MNTSLFSHSSRKRAQNKTKWPFRVLYTVARLILGGVFIYASIDKILHPAAFAEAVYNYQVLPDGFINLVAIVLPWLEFFLGTFLIIGFWMPGTAIISNLLLMTFMGALVFNLSRGLDIHCGCFSTSPTDNPMDAWTVLRDGSFLILAIYLLFTVFFSRVSAVLKADK